jgi:hypothetical protein
MSRPKPAEARTGHAAKTPTITRSAVPAVLPDPPEGLGDFGVWLWVEVWKQGAGDGELKAEGWKWPDMISVLAAEVKSLRQRVAELETS